MFKKITLKATALMLIAMLMLICFNISAFAVDSPIVGGQSVILMDPRSEQVLFERNADEKCSIASITKIMTTLVAMDKIESGEISFNEKATVSREAASIEGSRIYLMTNDQITVHDLLIATVVRSANDAAYALAEHISSGNIEDFVALMNAKAKELGMTNTHFANPEGLEHPENYSTARDITKMAMKFCENSTLAELAKAPSAVIRNNKVTIENTNVFLKKYPGATGLKTGYTEAAGYCLVATASREGTDLLSVILNLPDDNARIRETEALMDWGFANFKSVGVSIKGQSMGHIKISNSDIYRVSVIAANDFSVIVSKNVEIGTDLKVVIEKNKVKAPFEAGKAIGVAKLMKGNEELGRVDLLAEVSAKKTNIFVRIWRAITGIFSRD